MVFESELKKELNQAKAKLEQLNKLYQRYFMGEDKLPPVQARAEFDRLVFDVKNKVNKSNSTSDKFLMSNLYSLFQSYKGRWEKRLREIEDGIVSPHELKRRKIK